MGDQRENRKNNLMWEIDYHAKHAKLESKTYDEKCEFWSKMIDFYDDKIANPKEHHRDLSHALKMMFLKEAEKELERLEGEKNGLMMKLKTRL